MSAILFHYVLPTIHMFSCFFLIVVVLLQTGKGADMGAVFGGGSQTLFGSGGAGNFLTRLTTATAIVFMLTSLVLTYGQTPSSSSRLIQKLPPPSAEVPVEQAPAADTAAPAEAPVAAAPEAGEPTAETPPAAQVPPAGGQAPAATPAEPPAPAPKPAPKKR
jgi:preprotein translocase subunit SecG